jgi:nonribosomal peptide synthetase DhbF
MSADYLDQIRNIQPGGPYHLLGWSFGGLVAFDIASRLQLQGEQVALLTLIESYPFDQWTSRHIPDEQEVIRTTLEALGYDRAILGEGPLQLSTIKELFRQKDSVYSNLEDQYFGAIPRIGSNNVRLASSFVPETFDGDLLFFAAVEDSPASPTDAWRSYVRGQIRVHQVASAHARMTEPGPLAAIGQVLAAELEKAGKQPKVNPTNK